MFKGEEKDQEETPENVKKMTLKPREQRKKDTNVFGMPLNSVWAFRGDTKVNFSG